MSAEQLELEVSRRRDTSGAYRSEMIAAVTDAGTKAALEAEDPLWLERASEVIERFAAPGEPFDADDVRAVVGDPVRPGSMGGLFRQAARQRLIVPAGLRTSARIARHGGLLRRWRGVER